MTTKQTATLTSMYEDDKKFGWLDSVADPVQGTVSKLFSALPGGMKVKSMLNGTPIRHRLHPAIIILPIGAWTIAQIFDLMGRSKQGDDRATFYRAADTAISIGILGAMPAAKTGIADWVDLGGHRRRVGMSHALLNVGALTLYTTSLALRKSSGNHRGLAQILSGSAYSMVALSGAIGGEMVYTLGVNVPHNHYPTPPDEFTDVMASSDLKEGTPVVVEVGRVPVMVIRQGGDIYAVDSWCPHAGGPLADGTFEGDVVECPWHQSRFCIRDGKPLQGPATAPLRTFDVKVEQGRISVRPNYEGQHWPPAPEPPAAEPQAADD